MATVSKTRTGKGPGMWKHIGETVVVLAVSGCAQTLPSAEVAQAEASIASLERAADGASCPRAALQIHEWGTKARNDIEMNNLPLFDMAKNILLTLAEECKLEKAECGKGPAHIGMTSTEAKKTDWCFPEKRNTTEIAGHLHEQWIYKSPYDRKRGYLYFDNDRLTAIQETP